MHSSLCTSTRHSKMDAMVSSHHITSHVNESRMTSEPQPESRDHVICERRGSWRSARRRMHHSPLIVLVLWLLTVAGISTLFLFFPPASSSRLYQTSPSAKDGTSLRSPRRLPTLGANHRRHWLSAVAPESVSSPSPQVTVMSSYIPLSQREPGLDLHGPSEGMCRRRFSLATALRYPSTSLLTLWAAESSSVVTKGSMAV
jgi:hypothetical protein